MIQHIKQKIKQNNGFTGQDILIALFILMLFLSAFTTIMVNLSSTSKEIDDVKKITERITKIADKIDALEFDAIENQLEDEEITKLIGKDGNIGSDKLKVFYTANGDDDLKTINLKVKRLNSKNEIPEENVFEMKLSKQAVTIESDTGDGSGSGDGSGDGSGTGTETKPIESVEYTSSTETTTREDIAKKKVTFINGLTLTDGNSFQPDIPEGSITVVWSKTNSTVYNTGGNQFSFWEGVKVKKIDEKYRIIEKTIRSAKDPTEITSHSKRNISIDKDTFVILAYKMPISDDINIGDYIEFDFDYTQHTGREGKKAGIGNLTVYRNKTTTTTNPPKTLYKTSEHTIKVINQFDGSGRPTIVYSNSNQKVADVVNSTNSWTYWDAYVMKKQNDHYYVAQVLSGDKSKYQLNQDEFILFFHGGYTNKPTLKIGDCVQLNFDYSTLSPGINGDGYGQVSIFNTETKPEEEQPKPEGPKEEIVINTNAQYPHNRPLKTSEVNSKGYEFGTGKYLTPIKFVWTEVTATSKKGYWVKTTEDDPEWYSLEENIWPTFSYSTASFRNPGSVTGYTKQNSLQPLKSNPFTGLMFSKTNADDKYIFIWLPRMIRNLNTEEQVNKADYFWAYEKTNKKILSSQEGYYDIGGSQQEYSYNLYSDNLNTVYARGTILGWYRDKKENDGWDELLNLITNDKHKYNVNLKLEQQIRNINRHEGDQPRR